MRAAIDARLDAVEELLKDHKLRGELRELLEACADIQRLTTRVSTARANPKDLAAIARTLRMLPQLKAKLAGRQVRRCCKTSNAGSNSARTFANCSTSRSTDDPPYIAKDGGVIRAGFSAELDELRTLTSEGKNWIARYQAQEITRTGIASLKVGFNQVHGYYIEVTHANASKVPPDYVRKGTLKNAERYITPELKEYEEKVLTRRGQEQGARTATVPAGPRPGRGADAATLNTADVLAAVGLPRGARGTGRGAQLRPARARRRADSRHPATAGTRCSIRFCRRARSSPTTSAFGPDARLVLAHHRAEHGGQDHLHPAGRAAHADGAHRQLRPGEGGDDRHHRPHLHARRRERRTQSRADRRSWSR